MFSSFSNFLPSALSRHIDEPPSTSSALKDKEETQSKVTDVATDGPTVKEKDMVEEEPSKKEKKDKKKKDKLANETFILVRPPPAKSNHPLNLQVQLVPPNSRAPGGINAFPTTPHSSRPSTPRQSIDAEQDDLALRRTSSAASSTYSASASESGYTNDANASTSSFASTSTTSSSRRMIVPLYNLQAHNVLANTIVDAGTDAKIAKFHKRGLEIMDLAIWEVLEVWAMAGSGGSAPAPTESGFKKRPSQSQLSQTLIRPKTPETPTPAPQLLKKEETTPGSSHLSLSSIGIGSDALAGHTALDGTTPTAEVVSPKKRNIFGKLFNKKDSPAPTSALLSPDPDATPTKSNGRGPSFLTPLSSHSRSGSKEVKRSSVILAIHPPSHAESLSSVDGLPNTAATTSEFGFTGGAPLTATMGSTQSETPSNSNFLTVGGPGGEKQAPTLLPATLGIQPTLSSLLPFPFPLPPTVPYPPNLAQAVQRLSASSISLAFESGGHLPRGPAMYVWIVRKWIKGDDKGLFSGIARNSGFSIPGAGNGGNGGVESRVEVRVEWKRGRDKEKEKEKDAKKKGKDQQRGRQKELQQQSTESRPTSSSRRSSKILSNSVNPSQTSLTNSVDDAAKIKKKKNRLSLVSAISASLSDIGLSDNGTNEEKRSLQDEDEDPEDDETPWVCTIKARPKGPLVPGSGDGSGVCKLKVGTLSPTPHHPKVVAMLKVPYPLPDVNIEPTIALIPRPPSNEPPNEHNKAGLMVTAEEIKDVICSTALWMVVREGFGGMGKVGRKGDGWRIRA